MTEAKTSTIVIRKADAYDAVNLMRIAEAGVKESVVGYPPFDPNMGLAWIQRVIEHGVVYVADLSGRIVGSVGLELNHFPWNPEAHLQTAWLYVLPSFRAYGTAQKLMRAAEQFLDQRELRVIIEFAGGLDADKKDRWMLQRGYRYAGGSFSRLPRKPA